MTTHSILNTLAQREGWHLDSPQAPTRARWRFDAGNPDIEVRVEGQGAVITVDGATAIIDLTGCETVDDAVMRIEEESQLIAG